MVDMLSGVRRITKTMDDATASTLLSNCGSISGSKLFCCPMAILGRGAAQNIVNVITLYTLFVKQLRCIATDGNFAERFKDLAACPGDVDWPLAAHRATLLQESLAESSAPVARSVVGAIPAGASI